LSLGTWRVEHEVADICGLFICRDFLSPAEVAAFRLVFAAHQGWAMYQWGTIGRKKELASILQRIDFGLDEMTAEGVAAQSKSFTRAIGRHQQRLIQLLEARMRQVFALAGLWRECDVRMMEVSRVPRRVNSVSSHRQL